MYFVDNHTQTHIQTVVYTNISTNDYPTESMWCIECPFFVNGGFLFLLSLLYTTHVSIINIAHYLQVILKQAKKVLQK